MKRTIAVAFSLCAVLVCAVFIPTSFASTQPAVPITVAKAAPTPAPSSSKLAATTLSKKSKTNTTKSATTQPAMMSSVPAATPVTFEFTVPSALTPAGVEEVSATVKCYEVTSLSNGSTPSVSLSSTGLAVFQIGSTSGYTSVALTLTPGVTTSLNLNCPTSTAGKQLILIITGQGEDLNSEVFDFAGYQGLVVLP